MLLHLHAQTSLITGIFLSLYWIYLSIILISLSHAPRIWHVGAGLLLLTVVAPIIEVVLIISFFLWCAIILRRYPTTLRIRLLFSIKVLWIMRSISYSRRSLFGLIHRAIWFIMDCILRCRSWKWLLLRWRCMPYILIHITASPYITYTALPILWLHLISINASDMIRSFSFISL